MEVRPNIYTIPSGSNFLATLAQALVDGRLIDGFIPINDPILLQSATIYVPTRRAARTLGAEFLNAMGTTATILPSIRTLGDEDEEETYFLSPDDVFIGPNEIGELERKLQLYSLVQQWTDAISAETRALFGDEDIVIPSSPSDAMWLAQDLADLMDQMATEEVDWGKVSRLAPDEQPQWWQLTVAFLKIAIDIWPEHLAELKKVEPSIRRRAILDRRTQIYARNGSSGPVIAAGSTGTIPATSRLLQTIASLSNGCVVLPGLDKQMEYSDWEILLRDDDELISTPNLSQQGLAKFVSACQLSRADVSTLNEVQDALKAREKMVSLALSPGENSDKWIEAVGKMPAQFKQLAFEDIVLVEASGVRQEAMAIALAMREVLESKNQTVALVTPDRKIAKRVASELERYDIKIDDSGGDNLHGTQSGRFIRLILENLNRDVKAVDLVALLKHPFCRVGLPQAEAYTSALLFELALVRGNVQRPKLGQFAEFCTKAERSSKEYVDRKVQAISKTKWEDLLSYCVRLDDVLSPFASFRQITEPVPASRCMELLRETVAGLSMDELGTSLAFAGLGGGEYQRIFSEFDAVSKTSSNLTVQQFQSYFEAVVGDKSIRNPTAITHPRLHILGPLEARLHSFDRVILAGLNEGTWPPKTRSDPFLNRIMRSQIGLSPPERRIGLSAHDFQQLAGTGQFFMTRSTQVDGAPTIASRWIQRLCAIAGETITKSLRERGAKYTRWADQIDQPANPPVRVVRPNPKPPVDVRPTRLSVSDVETWIRDPYAIYGKHILNLRPLEPLEQEIGPALRGSLYHEILGKYVEQRQANPDQAGIETLMTIARNEFKRQNVPEDAAAIWLPRFQNIAEKFVAWDDVRVENTRDSKIEVSGKLTLNNGAFTLTARADRLDINLDGSLTILDYKTGTKPTANEARAMAPQLPLEGAIALEGRFGPGLGTEIRSLGYVRLRPGSEFKLDRIERQDITPDEICGEARSKLETHIVTYQNLDQGYISRYAPADPKNLDGDYDHLARTLEWYSGGLDGEESDA